jgi:hypothetical protein
MATDIFYTEIPLEGKERRRRNRCIVACFCVAGVVVSCDRSIAFVMLEQCSDASGAML